MAKIVEMHSSKLALKFSSSKFPCLPGTDGQKHNRHATHRGGHEVPSLKNPNLRKNERFALKP